MHAISRLHCNSEPRVCDGSMKYIYIFSTELHAHRKRECINMRLSCKVKVRSVSIVRVSFRSCIFSAHSFFFEDGRQVPRTNSPYARIHILGQFRVSTPPDWHMSLECERKPEKAYANTERTRNSSTQRRPKEQTWILPAVRRLPSEHFGTSCWTITGLIYQLN